MLTLILLLCLNMISALFSFTVLAIALSVSKPLRMNTGLGFSSKSKDCDPVICLIQKTIDSHDLKPMDWKKNGLVLSSVKAERTLEALKNPRACTIEGVPVDDRKEAELILEKSLSRPRSARDRHDLLCNSGIPGSGKSVLQAFNLQWFVERTKGIAIELTYNSDQAQFSVHQDSPKSFMVSLAVRIIHRLLNYFIGDAAKARSVIFDSECIEWFTCQDKPLQYALDLTKHYLNASHDVKILLGIDEFSKIHDSLDFRKNCLSELTEVFDDNSCLFLSVSVISAFDLGSFATYSGRQLLYQSLRPLWHDVSGFDEATLSLLPFALQPFFNEKMRKSLPYDAVGSEMQKYSALYFNILNCLLHTAGHPRRLENLCFALRPFDNEFDSKDLAELVNSNNTVARAAGCRFAESMIKWVSANNRTVMAAIQTSTHFPTNFQDLIDQMKASGSEGATESSIMETIARDCGRRFKLHSQKLHTLETHRASLLGTENGHCNILSSATDAIAFLPIISLDYLESFCPDRPCGKALQVVREAVKLYLNLQTEAGKGLESVVAAALLLYARSNENVLLSAVCKEVGSGMSCVLKGGSSVELLYIESFPLKSIPIAPNHVTSLLGQLSAKSTGAVIVPRFKYNEVGDLYLLLWDDAAKEWAMTVFQCKDHFRINGNDLVQMWGKGRSKLFPESGKLTFKNKRSGKMENMRFRYVLFTSNEVPVPTLKSNEAISDLMEMRKWLPTAGYACQNSRQLKAIFAPLFPKKKVWSKIKRL